MPVSVVCDNFCKSRGNDGGPDTSPEEGGVSYLHMPFEADSIVNGPASLAGP